MALLKPNTRRKLPSTDLNLVNPRGLISPSVRGLLLSFPHALRYGLNIQRLLFLVFRYSVESMRFLRGCSLLYCRYHFTSLIDWQYRRILPVANQYIPSIPGKSRSFRTGHVSHFFGQTKKLSSMLIRSCPLFLKKVLTEQSKKRPKKKESNNQQKKKNTGNTQVPLK